MLVGSDIAWIFACLADVVEEATVKTPYLDGPSMYTIHFDPVLFAKRLRERGKPMHGTGSPEPDGSAGK